MTSSGRTSPTLVIGRTMTMVTSGVKLVGMREAMDFESRLIFDGLLQTPFSQYWDLIDSEKLTLVRINVRIKTR